VYFRQVKDASLRRGYFQKVSLMFSDSGCLSGIGCILMFHLFLLQSVVILSKFPFVNLFNQMLDLIAPEFFENGPDSIAVSKLCLYSDKLE